MKTNRMIPMLAALLMSAGAAFGQNTNCPNGYSGPPKSPEERAARQAACQQANGGVCPNGGPRAAACTTPGQGKRQGPGQGKGPGKGLGKGKGTSKGLGPCGGAGKCGAA
jgi:hypothetical protein